MGYNKLGSYDGVMIDKLFFDDEKTIIRDIYGNKMDNVHHLYNMIHPTQDIIAIQKVLYNKIKDDEDISDNFKQALRYHYKNRTYGVVPKYKIDLTEESTNELDLFNRLYNIMFSSIKKPDLLIYLHSDIKRLQQNIKKRGRKYERNISDNYLKSIETKYFNYINKQNSYNVLILDVTNVNFIKDQSIYAEIIAEINKFDKSKKIIRKILT